MTAGPALVPLLAAAKELGIGESLAYKLADAGRGELLPGLPVIRIGSRLVVSRAQLDRIITEGITVPA